MEHTFIVYSANQQDVEWLQSTLLPHQVLSVDDRLDAILALSDTAGASLVFIGLDQQNMTSQCSLIEGLLAARPLLTVVGMGDGMDNQLVINAMRAGARDFIVYGMRNKEVLGLVRRLTQRLPMVPQQQSTDSISLIYSAQPEPDAALVAVYLAEGRQKKGQRVLLIDLGRPEGESLNMLGLEQGFTFGDALRNLRRLDSSMIESAFSQHHSGLCVLTRGEDDPEYHDVASTELYLLKGRLASILTISLSTWPVSMTVSKYAPWWGCASRFTGMLTKVCPVANATCGCFTGGGMQGFGWNILPCWLMAIYAK
ncbi:hypothetical protein MBH78_11580 [Oceanimonas sp. NS1]|nr:hypothetical protein [Oceanimonas sp. NS1]